MPGFVTLGWGGGWWQQLKWLVTVDWGEVGWPSLTAWLVTGGWGEVE